MVEQNEEITRKLSSNLLAIAKRHEGYQTLWNLCSDHNDLELLRSLMVWMQTINSLMNGSIWVIFFYPLGVKLLK